MPVKQVASELVSRLGPGRGIRTNVNSGISPKMSGCSGLGGSPAFKIWSGHSFSVSLYFPLPSFAAIVFTELKIFVEYLLHTKF